MCTQLMEHTQHRSESHATTEQHNWPGAFFVQHEGASGTGDLQEIADLHMVVQVVGPLTRWQLWLVERCRLTFDRNADARKVIGVSG
ncbi:hypothetical protein D3C84_1144280 [compost metagenome]